MEILVCKCSVIHQSRVSEEGFRYGYRDTITSRQYYPLFVKKDGFVIVDHQMTCEGGIQVRSRIFQTERGGSSLHIIYIRHTSLLLTNMGVYFLVS
jgi:hypothetical protein